MSIELLLKIKNYHEGKVHKRTPYCLYTKNKENM